MAGSQNPQSFSFGPYTLRTFPKFSNLSFRSKAEMKPEQQCLMDNLWAFRSKPNYADIIHSLAYYLTFLSTTISNQEMTLQSIQSDRFGNLSLGPQKPISELEKENNMLRVSMKEKERKINEMEEELKELREKKNEWEKIKNEGKRILREREEKMLLFPEKIQEVQEKILVEICAEQMAQMANVQQRLEKGVTIGLPAGMEINVLSLKGDQHNQQVCTCQKGFNLFRVSLHLGAWRDLDEDFSVATFFKQGIISRIIVTSPKQVTKFLAPLSWRLAHVIYNIFERGWVKDEKFGGYVNLQFQSIPCAYGGKANGKLYPDEARHEILIVADGHGFPIQRQLSSQQYRCNERDTIDQLEDARCYLKANAERNSWTRKYTLIFEDHTLKVYGDPRYKYTTIYVPFLRHVDENPEKTHHYQAMKSHVIIKGDDMNRMVDGDPEPSSDGDSAIGLDDIAEENLENMLEP